MIPVTGFKSSTTGHDVHLVNYGPIESKKDDKEGFVFSR